MIKEFIVATGLLNLYKPDKKHEDRNSDYVELTRKNLDYSNLEYYAIKFSEGAKQLGVLHNNEALIWSLSMSKLPSDETRIEEEALLFNYRLLLEAFFDKENYKSLIDDLEFYSGVQSLESVFNYIENKEKKRLGYLFNTSDTTIYRWKKLKNKISKRSLVKIKNSLEKRLNGNKEEVRKKVNTYILLIHISTYGISLEESLKNKSTINIDEIKRKLLTIVLYFSVKDEEKAIPARFKYRECLRNKEEIILIGKGLVSSVIDMMEFPICFICDEENQQVVDAILMSDSMEERLRKEENEMKGPNTDNMTKDELDLWSDIHNGNNDANMDDWANAHNPNNDSYLEDD